MGARILVELNISRSSQFFWYHEVALGYRVRLCASLMPTLSKNQLILFLPTPLPALRWCLIIPGLWDRSGFETVPRLLSGPGPGMLRVCAIPRFPTSPVRIRMSAQYCAGAPHTELEFATSPFPCVDLNSESGITPCLVELEGHFS